MFDIENIQVLYNGNAVKYTKHFKARMEERGIKKQDVYNVILTGEIIEQSPDDEPLPSVLIFGYTKDNRPLHIAVSIDDYMICLVTAYYPTLEEWESDYKNRKKGENL